MEVPLRALAVVHEGAPRLVGCVQSPLFETPDQVVSSDVLNVHLTHEKSVVLVPLEKLRDNVPSHFLEDHQCLGLFGSLDIDELSEPFVNGHGLLSRGELLEASSKLPPLASSECADLFSDFCVL